MRIEQLETELEATQRKMQMNEQHLNERFDKMEKGNNVRDAAVMDLEQQLNNEVTYEATVVMYRVCTCPLALTLYTCIPSKERRYLQVLHTFMSSRTSTACAPNA